MNNYCRNCGEKISGNICQKCGVEVIDKRVNIEEKTKEIKKFKDLETKYILIIIIIGAVAYFISTIPYLNILSPLIILCDIIFAIYVRIKMAASKLIRILFLIACILGVLYLLGMIILVIACYSLMGGF